MAATVLSGDGSFTYTNTTGGNVRVIINYYTNYRSTNNGTSHFLMSWGTPTVSIDSGSGQAITTQVITFGRNLAHSTGGIAISANNMLGSNATAALPTEIMLPPGQTFTVTAKDSARPLGPYNIVVIPEAG
jgi:hypothetical protein